MKKIEGVVVKNIGGGCCKPQGDRFEVIEDFTVGIVDGAMALINDNKVKELG